jgi:cytoskeletal protein CcmA (bactofilin family)
MWNKDKREFQPDTGIQREPESRFERPERPMPPPPQQHERVEPMRPTGAPAVIGRSISIRGEVTGDEDMVIQGRVDGSVDLKQHSVTIGPEGEVKANIVARVVTVEGSVHGNLSGQEQVVLRASARVEGDIVAPRVVLEDGTLFRGSVEMGEAVRQRTAAATAIRPDKKPEPVAAAKPAEAEKRPAGPGSEPAKGKPQPAAVGEVKG